MKPNNYQEYQNDLEKLRELVETTIDLEAAENHEYIVRDEFDDELRGKRFFFFIIFFYIKQTSRHKRTNDRSEQKVTARS